MLGAISRSLTHKTQIWCNYLPSRRFGKYETELQSIFTLKLNINFSPGILNTKKTTLMLSNFNIQTLKNHIPGLLQILQGSDRFPGSIATLAGLDLLGVLEPLEQVDPVTYLSLVGVASLQGPVAP